MAPECVVSERRRRVLNLHWGFIPGGVSTYAKLLENVGLYSPLETKGLCINCPEWPLDEASLRCMNMEFVYIKNRGDLSWVPKTRAIVLREKPELILTFGFNGAFVAALTGYNTGVPIYASWHGDYYPTTPAQKLRKPFFDVLLKVLFRYVVRDIIVVSTFSKNTLIAKGISRHKIYTIYNGISDIPPVSKKRREIRQSLGVPDQGFLGGTVCRLVAPKGLDCFLQAIALIAPKRQDIRFVIWGDGPLKGHLQSLSVKLGINEVVTFAGYRSDIADCLSALDVFVMSSFVENFSIALLEAMRAGLAIVATKVGGNPEAIEDRVQGILVPFADPRALANGVLTLLSDEELRRAMATRARERFLAEFTADKMVQKTAQWMMECARKHSSHMAGKESS